MVLLHLRCRLSLTVALAVGVLAATGCARPSETESPRQAQTPQVVPAVDAPALAASAELVEDLTYKQWQSFPKGTTVVRRTTTHSGKVSRQTVSHTTLKLLDKTDDVIVIEEQTHTVRSTGEKVQNEPMTFRYSRKIPLPPNIRKEDWGKPQGVQQEGEEELEVLGKTYRCRYFKYTSPTEAGEMQTTIWISSEIPGGLVKSYSYIPNADETTTIELTQITIPKQ